MSKDTSGNDKPADTDDDTSIIAECCARMAISIAANADNRRMAKDDLTFMAGEQWDPAIKRQREIEGRPCLTINKIQTSLHQLTNTQRQNVPSLKVHATTDGNVDIAQIIQGGIRAIEYKSGASVCYDTAVNGAAAIGEGYFRIVTKYAREDSFDQEIAFQRIRNPFSVYMDPSIIQVDGSDQNWCILSNKVPRSDLKAEYPDADPCDFNTIRGIGDVKDDWVTADTVRIAEYYRIKRVPASVVQLSNGESGYEDDLGTLPTGITITQRRKGVKSTVEWFKVTALEVLERAIIPCRWIPVFPVFGDEVEIDGKVIRSGMIRHSKDPARMYNYWMTAATEQVGMMPRAPYIGAEGQFEGHPEWDNANTRSYSKLEYKPVTLHGNLAPAPVRQPMIDVPTGVLAMANHASDDLKATSGIFDASLGNRSNETSGVAISKRDRQGETSNFHYTDNLNTTITHAGRCIIDMWPTVMDGSRTLEIMGEDGKLSSAKINQLVPDKNDDGTPKVDIVTKRAIMRVENDMTVGDYGVTVGAGPSFDTMRQEAVQGMMQTAQSWPKLMDVAGDKVVRAMDWPGADQIADRIERGIDPALRKGEDGADEAEGMVDTPRGPIPKAQVGPMLDQMDKQLQQLHAQLQEATSGITKTKITADASIQVARIQAENREDVEELKGWIQLLMAKMQPPPALTSDVVSDLSESPQLGDNAPINTRPVDSPPMDQALQGDSLPMGTNTGQGTTQ